MPASSRPLSRASDAHHDPFLIRLRAGQHRQAAAALTASHADYPASRAVFAGPERRARALHAFFATTVRDAIDHGLVDAMRTDGVVEGVAVWLPPGGFPWSAARKLRATRALLRVAAADPAAFGRFIRYGAKAERAHPTDTHWYLVVLGIRPDAQRSGLGSRLLGPGLAPGPTSTSTAGSGSRSSTTRPLVPDGPSPPERGED